MSVETTGSTPDCTPDCTPGTSGDVPVPPRGPLVAAPAGTRPGRPGIRRETVRPGGRRQEGVLPPVRPRVGGGTDRAAVRARPLPTVVVRRRCAAAAIVLALVLGVLVGVLASLGPVAPTGAVPAATTVTVVAGGESLTDVARRAAPGSDADAVVARIRELNGLDGLGGSAVVTGRPLVVPAGPAAP